MALGDSRISAVVVGNTKSVFADLSCEVVIVVVVVSYLNVMICIVSFSAVSQHGLV